MQLMVRQRSSTGLLLLVYWQLGVINFLFVWTWNKMLYMFNWTNMLLLWCSTCSPSGAAEEADRFFR
ncbi:hypothetical protein Mgra_00000853 [Meloidogyne graminicola]|uniref:Uncharacterized protein n=1 Tax=Meloidogyne graminicola TaxID=189291 RepID=A0A8T0A0I2_9BILA|nr:hypothetical protein Mgra_00000853 [Meloidogyne graminicola]